ncbi:Hypothetical predicted protein [Cloeon dipterum]|uniref:Tetraspanin n=1 Tax=Cloeon dipterum TaxID=197152 RepID=A0A8S1DQ80_9INSE|nr:Hypothetical predicted protein [Cloeon dipterum]
MAIVCDNTNKCAKAGLIFFNLIFWASGAALILLGASMLLDQGQAVLLTAVAAPGMPPLLLVAFGLVGLGSVVLVVGILGCFAGLVEQLNKCLLGTYFTFLFLVFAAEVSLVVATLLFREQTISGLESRLRDRLHNQFNRTGHEHFSDAYNFAQYKFECCGATKVQDFELWAKMQQPDNGQNGPRVPITCCMVQKTTTPDASMHGMLMGIDIDEWRTARPVRSDLCQSQGVSEARHERGCLQPLEDWFKDKSLLVLAVGLAASLLQILGMAYTACLCKVAGK